MTDAAWIERALTTSRPQAVAALLRYFRNLDTAEEAYQEACLRALRNWTVNGPPRDPTSWLIMVGRNAALGLIELVHFDERGRDSVDGGDGGDVGGAQGLGADLDEFPAQRDGFVGAGLEGAELREVVHRLGGDVVAGREGSVGERADEKDGSAEDEQAHGFRLSTRTRIPDG